MVYVVIAFIGISIIIVYIVWQKQIQKRNLRLDAERIEGAIPAHITILTKELVSQDNDWVKFKLTFTVERADGSSYTAAPEELVWIDPYHHLKIKKGAEFDVYLRPGREDDFMFENEYRRTKAFVENNMEGYLVDSCNGDEQKQRALREALGKEDTTPQ